MFVVRPPGGGQGRFRALRTNHQKEKNVAGTTQKIRNRGGEKKTARRGRSLTLRGRNAAASPPIDRVIAQEMTAYFIDRSVSFSKQCLGITLITSRFVGNDFGSSASPFNPLSCTPSMSIAAGAEGSTATEGGIATAMFSERGRKAPRALVVPAVAVRDGDEKRENDEEWVKAVVVPQEHSATAEAVAAAVAFILSWFDA